VTVVPEAVNRGGDAGLDGGVLGVEPTDVAEELEVHPFAFPVDGLDRAHGPQRSSRGRRRHRRPIDADFPNYGALVQRWTAP
jgi:hypothetical protein